VLGSVTVAGRDAIAVAATPRRDVLGSGSAKRPYDRIEVAMDAELGILLRRTETSGGEVLTRTELTAVTMNPPEAAGPARFAPPPGSQFGEDLKETMRQKFSGPGWDAADVAALNRTNGRARARKTRCSGMPNSSLSSNPDGGGPAASTATFTAPLASHSAVNVRSGPVSLVSTAVLACCLASAVPSGVGTGTT
jgi:hypothetical protein